MKRFFPKVLQRNSINANYLNPWAALSMVLGTVVLGVAGLMIIEGYDFRHAFYMVIITVSTVGYGEVEPLSSGGQLFISLFIILNIGIFAYALAVFSSYVIEGQLFKNLHLNTVKQQIEELDRHVILCGFGKYGQEIAERLINQKMQFIVIESTHDIIEQIQKRPDPILYLEGDATDDDLLLQAGIERAKVVITTLPDDSENLFVTLTARQLNSKLTIISRAENHRSIKKIETAGADHVVMPTQIGSFYMSTLVTKPKATEFFTFLTDEYAGDVGFEEVECSRIPRKFIGKEIRDLNLRRETGANIIGYKERSGKYVVNPGPDTLMVKGSSLILLGSTEQLQRLREYLDVDQLS